MMENMEFEEKVDIDDLVLPSEPMKLLEIESKNQLKKKSKLMLLNLIMKKKKFKLRMEGRILKLYEELEKETWENSTMDIGLRRSLKIKKFVEKIAQYNSLERYHEVQPFSCKFCDKSFHLVHEVKEHIKIHTSISEVEDLRKQLKSLKTQVEELEAKLKISQSHLAFQTGKKNKLKKKAKLESEQEIKNTERKKPGNSQEQKKKFKRNENLLETQQETSETKMDQQQVEDILKVSKFQKQIFLFLFEQKAERFFFYFCPKDLKWAK